MDGQLSERNHSVKESARYSNFGKQNINATESVLSYQSREAGSTIRHGTVKPVDVADIDEQIDDDKRNSQIKDEFKSLLYKPQEDKTPEKEVQNGPVEEEKYKKLF